MCAHVSQRLALPTAIDWSNPRSSKLEKIRFKEEMAHGYKKENEGSLLGGGGAAEILGGGAGYRLEGQRFGHT